MGSFKHVLAFFCVVSVGMVQISVSQNTPQDFLNLHNSARAKVGSPRMQWNDTVAAYAQSYANQRIADCQLIHSPAVTANLYGENLYWAKHNATAADAVATWEEEKRYYNYGTNTCSEPCGHFTQLVWSRSLQLGCARVRCQNSGFFIICNYYPRGNYGWLRPY